MTLTQFVLGCFAGYGMYRAALADHGEPWHSPVMRGGGASNARMPKW